ncbi:MAG: hypothetical protein NVSMB1_17600 [Polyangiales bacterium]
MRAIAGPLSVVLLSAVSVASAIGCSGSPSSNGQGGALANELTSNTALARTLNFQAFVYVDEGTTDFGILDAINRQTQSAFGALRTAMVGVNNRELKVVDERTFVKTRVKVIDTGARRNAPKNMVRVSYRYTDTAVVPNTMGARSALSTALLNGVYSGQSDRIMNECTANDAEAKEFKNQIWYVFDPSLDTCKAAMAKEQRAIDAARSHLHDLRTEVSLAEVNRLYLPMTAALVGDKTNKGASYPEYDRLWSGGVQRGKLVVGMVNGRAANWAAGEHLETVDDAGYAAWFDGLHEIFAVSPGLKVTKVDPPEDLTTFTVGSTKVTGVTFKDISNWERTRDGFPANIDAAKQRDLRVAAAKKLSQHWITFEQQVKVALGTAPAKTVVLQINSFYGSDGEDASPHRRAIKESDIFVYNGHSYIGYGPLDPANFRASDFPSSYQIFMINSCVSFNYYDKDYFALKDGGTRNLDVITNGLETPIMGGGTSIGRLVASLIDGKLNSYSTILKNAQFDFPIDSSGGMNDALRVVDGELDNRYAPGRPRVSVTR